jgi:hypothetical protein
MRIYVYRNGELVESIDIGEADQMVIVNGTSVVHEWNSASKEPASDVVVKAEGGEWHFDDENNAIRRAQKIFNSGDRSVIVMVEDKVIWPYW